MKKNAGLFSELFKADHNIKVVLLNKTRLIIFFLLHPFRFSKGLLRQVDFKQTLLKEFRLRRIEAFKPDIIHFEFSGIAVDYLNEMKSLN